MVKINRVMLEGYPFSDRFKNAYLPPWEYENAWPVNWVTFPDEITENGVYMFKTEFCLEKKQKIRIHITADERYKIYVDGEFCAWGSERGDMVNWFFETYDIDFEEGKHVVAVEVLQMRELAGWPQVTSGCALMVAADNEKFADLISTGKADWKCKRLDGRYFVHFNKVWIGTGGFERIDGNVYPWGAESGKGSGWKKVKVLDEVVGRNTYVINPAKRLVRPAMLPEMYLKERKKYCMVFADGFTGKVDKLTEKQILAKNNIIGDYIKQHKKPENDLVIPANTNIRFIIDLGEYCCDFPVVNTKGGKDSEIYVTQIEALYGYGEDASGKKKDDSKFIKGDRAAYMNKYLVGDYDLFITDGGVRSFTTSWWRAGRFVQVAVKTGETPLTITKLAFNETHYPFVFEGDFNCSDERINSYLPACKRVLQMCTHETYMDCPFYEQLMYVGDTRLQALTTNALARDNRLAKKAIEMFCEGMNNQTRVLNCAFPANSGKVIPSFCVWWVAMIYDYAMSFGDEEFIRKMIPSARFVMETYGSDKDEHGLLKTPLGWDFVDWVKGDYTAWCYGAPADSGYGVHAVFNFQYSYVAQMLAEIEEYIGEKEMAAKWNRVAKEVYELADKHFWSNEMKGYADDLDKVHYSEHAQILSGLNKLCKVSRMKECMKFIEESKANNFVDIYFEHYLFEFFKKCGRVDLFLERMNDWNLVFEQNFTTTPEHFSNETRSDCHAWGAHPILHCLTDILGIKSNEIGFERVLVKPDLCGMDWAEGSMVHQKGMIKAKYTRCNDVDNKYCATIELPEGIKGCFVCSDMSLELHDGKNEFTFEV